MRRISKNFMRFTQSNYSLKVNMITYKLTINYHNLLIVFKNHLKSKLNRVKTKNGL